MMEKSLYAKIREAGSHTLIYGLGSVAQTALGYILIPLYTRYYSTDMYGIFALLTVVGSLTGSVFYLGSSSALSRSYYDYTDSKDRKLVVSTALAITLFGAIVQISVGILFRNQISLLLFDDSQYGLHVAIVMAGSALSFINTLFLMLLRFDRRSGQVVSVSLFTLVLSASLIIYFLIVLDMGVLAPVMGTFLAQLVSLLLMLYFCRGYFGFGVLRHEIGVQLSFGIPSVVIGLGYYTLDSIDRVMINQLGSLKDVGVYSLGYMIGGMIYAFFVTPFGRIWEPMRLEYRNSPDAKELYRLVMTYYFAIGLLITVALSVFSQEIVMLIAERNEYLIAFRVVPWAMAGRLLYGSVSILDHGIIFERKVMYHVYIFWLTVGLNILLNYLLIPRFGYIAAAYTTLISYGFLITLVYNVSGKLYKVSYDATRLLKLAAFAVTVIVLGNTLSTLALLPTLIAKSGLVALYGLLLYWLVLNASEKAKLHDIVHKTVGAVGFRSR